MFTFLLCMVAIVSCVTGQRPFFAGSKPIGFPELYDKPTTEGLGNRFGENNGTTPRLPLEAQGDRELVDRLSKLPIDQQPFWLLNWQALEANRQKPQTYPQKPNTFVDNISTNPGGIQNTGNSAVNNQNIPPNNPNRNNFPTPNNNNNIVNRLNTPTGINNNNFNTPPIRNPNQNTQNNNFNPNRNIPSNNFDNPNQNALSNTNINTPSKNPIPNITPTKTIANNANLDNKNKPSLTTTGSVASVTVSKPSKVTVTPKAVQKDNAKTADYSEEYGSVEDINSEEVENSGKEKLDKFVALI